MVDVLRPRRGRVLLQNRLVERDDRILRPHLVGRVLDERDRERAVHLCADARADDVHHVG